MRNPLFLTLAGALLGTATLAQQGPQTKAKPKAKAVHAVKAAAATPAPDAPASDLPTDWSVPYAASITPDGLRKDLSVLASDEYEGRETGTKGQRMAADYISKRFAGLGLTGPVQGSDNAYIQHFQMNRVTTDPGTSVKIGGKTFVFNKDFYALVDGTFAAPTEVQPTFIGYGISTAAYSDLASAGDLKGKDLVVLMGEPKDKEGKPLLPATGPDGKARPAYGEPTAQALFARAGALRPLAPRSTFYIMPTADAFAQVPTNFKQVLGRDQLVFGDTAPRRGQNLFILSPEMGAALLGAKPAALAKYDKAVAQAGKPVASPFKPTTATVQAVQKRVPFTTENVLGYLEGTDKKDELVVMSAHYDHLGIKDGKVFNGADDDGSGTVSVLAFADAFAQAKKDGHGPRRSILFLANTGEEEGLLGSQYYTDHPVFPLESTVVDLNIDMVGRVDPEHEGKGDYVYVVGADKLSSELNAVSEATNQKYSPIALDYKYNDPNDPEHIYYRSDHYNFAKHKIPVAFYTSGLHADYHKETDEVDKINFPAMARRDQLIFHTAWELANRANHPVVDSNKP